MLVSAACTSRDSGSMEFSTPLGSGGVVGSVHTLNMGTFPRENPHLVVMYVTWRRQDPPGPVAESWMTPAPNTCLW